MNITVSKTIQINQYEPLTITITEDFEVKDDESRLKAIRKLGKVLKKAIAVELERYQDD